VGYIFLTTVGTYYVHTYCYIRLFDLGIEQVVLLQLNKGDMVEVVIDKAGTGRVCTVTCTLQAKMVTGTALSRLDKLEAIQDLEWPLYSSHVCPKGNYILGNFFY
jgi:hypothetical protein